MDRGEDAHWRRVPGSRAIWFVGQKPPSAWDTGRAWALSRLRAVTGVGYALRDLLARLSRPRIGRRLRRDGAAPPRRRRRA